MSTFDHLAHRLALHGVAPRRIRRIVGELDDHVDVGAERMTRRGTSEDEAARVARTRLGSDDVLLDGFLATPGIVSLSRRRPGLVFGAAPAMVFLVVSVAWISALAGLAVLARDRLALDLQAPIYRSLAIWLDKPVDALIAAAVAWTFCATARERHCPIVWPASMCIILALLVGVVYTVVLPPNASGRGALFIGLGRTSSVHPSTWLPPLVPLAVLAADAALRVRAARAQQETTT